MGEAEGPHRWLADLFPGYFALVMATGIVAIAAEQQEIGWLAGPLYTIAALAYVVLVVLYVARLWLYRRRFVDDLTSHQRGFAFLTAVAATNVLGSASVVVFAWWWAGWALWSIGLALWSVLLYVSLVAAILRQPKPGLGTGINGSWFLLTVATESVAVLGALLLPRSGNELQALVCVSAFTLGIVLYVIVMTSVFLRWTFEPLDPTQADPPSWIAAGAVAITVLAGSNLLLARNAAPLVDGMAAFLEGMVVLAWATATFWLPVMVAIGVWRHLVRHVHLRYEPAYWALVFPIGMYGAATFRMRPALSIDALDILPEAVFVVALIAWALTFGGLLHHLVRAAQGSRR
jgi:tellurite resistance protein TehA-like permease